MSSKVKKVVVAYSGGLDTSVIIQWLLEAYPGCEVIAFAADVGQKEELDGLEQKAIKTGASKCFIEDLREEFARDFVFPMLRANAIYEGTYLMGTSIARPLIAKKQIEIAHREKADAVCHGATGKGNDQVRFELTYMALDPDIRIIAAWRDDKWKFTSREDMINFAAKHNIPLPVSKDKPYSSDRNALHISHEGGILEDPWNEPTEDIFTISVSPEKAPDKPTYVEIDFEKGNPVAVNGKKMSPATLLDHLNTVAGANGIGRVDMVENRFVGMKSRGVYETPAGRCSGRPPGRRDDHHGPRGDVHARRADPEVRPARLQRVLVLAGDECPAAVHRRHAGEGDGHGPAEALQGQLHRRRAQVAELALQRGHRLLREERRLRAEGRHGLHPAQRPAPAHRSLFKKKGRA